ncbi:WEB family protein At5g55860-like [Cucurbita moschata]|uniref:WEB family protein At5g55860-like n=1 Tax=Cucurbita moschata TaxID=3662 RepID=A0A6J1F893_CUCMO|nr:WEB family protein At5g55860-like [Cucurbita moschata]
MKSKMGVKDHQIATHSPNAKVVGEIDTSSPFQSVKDAVNLFGEGAFSGEQPVVRKTKQPRSAERVFAKETQLHLTEKELKKLKDQLNNAEITKSEALVELENNKRAVDELNKKLQLLRESKESAMKDSEVAKARAKQLEEANGSNHSGNDPGWKQDLETTRAQYMIAIGELDAAKHELRKNRQHSDASLEAKIAALKQVTAAEESFKTHKVKENELSKEILAAQESIEKLKLASLQAQQEQKKIFAEKDIQRRSYKAALEESAKKLFSLQKEIDPDISRNLESQLSETMNEIGELQKQMEDKKASDLDSVKNVTSELDDAKGSLQKVAEEERSLHSLVEALKLELENVRKEHSELKEREAEAESLAGNLHVQLRKSKSELEAYLAEESKARGACEYMLSTLNQLSSETENARRGEEEMKKKAEELRKEAEATKIAMEAAEKQLRLAVEEAEEAKAAEARALNQIKELSERTDAARASTSDFGANITISKEEFESLSRKVEESDTLAEMKVAAALAQVEAVKASENEIIKKLGASQKEIEDMKTATVEALKRAEMAEAAKKAVEGELRRWREREQKKAEEAASRILAETELSLESSSSHHRLQKQNTTVKTVETSHSRFQKLNTTVKRVESKKLEKEKTFSKKVLLPNLSGLFVRKKNKVEGGSPSYLPGEKSM